MTGAELLRVEVNGHSITYRQAGHGPALVLLHGFLCDSRCWKTQVADLSDQFNVVAWDAPGAGSSTDPSEAFTIAHWGECLSDFLDILGIDQAFVLGLSWGGLLAQELYRADPSRIRGLILADTYAGWKGSLSASACEQRLARCERESRLAPDEFAKLWVPEMFTQEAPQDLLDEMAEIISDFHPLGFRLMAKSLAETDTTELLSKIAVPTLVLWGDDDRRSPMNIAEQFRDTIPGATLAVVRNAGHVSNMEQPKIFNDHVRSFCSSA